MLLEPRSPAYLFLYGQTWFESLRHEVKNQLVNDMTLLKGNKGDTLLPYGSQADGWYAVLSGMIKIQSAAPDGRLSAFAGLPAGEWFGEGSTLKGEPRRYDVIALRDTTLLCMPLVRFNELRQQSLAFNQFLVSHLNRRLGQAMAVIEAGRLKSPEERVALYLSNLFWPATRKLNLSQEELGILAGLSRQTVNKVLKAFEARGWVSLEFGRVTILDEDGLAQLLRPRCEAQSA